MPNKIPVIKDDNITKSKRKRKRKVDSAWHPGCERRKKGRPLLHNKSPTKQSRLMLQLMQSLASPAKENQVRVSYSGDTPLSTQTTQISRLDTLSPNKTTLTTPKGSQLICSEKIIANKKLWQLFLPKSKMITNRIELPEVIPEQINSSPMPVVSFKGLPEICITKESINDIQKLKAKRQREGVNPRLIGQNALMGHLSARQALMLAQIDVPCNSVHYTHLLPWVLTGDQGQCVENLGIGTKQANARMELVNPIFKSLLDDNHLEKIYLQAIPTWEKGFEKIRLLKTITYIIKDDAKGNYQKQISIDFDMQSYKPTCASEIDPIINFLRAKFKPKSEEEPPKALELTPLYSKKKKRCTSIDRACTAEANKQLRFSP